MEKVNDQHWSKSTVNARADVAMTCLGLMWWPRGVTCGNEEVLARGGACRKVTVHWSFRRCVRACSVSESTVFCAVEFSVSRAFQRYWRCHDRSLGTACPRVVVGPFGYESAS